MSEGRHSQGEVVEAHRPQGEGSGQETHVREQNSDGLLEGGQLLEDRGRLDQLPVRLRLLDLRGRTDRTGSEFRSSEGRQRGVVQSRSRRLTDLVGGGTLQLITWCWETICLVALLCNVFI